MTSPRENAAKCLTLGLLRRLGWIHSRRSGLQCPSVLGECWWPDRQCWGQPLVLHFSRSSECRKSQYPWDKAKKAVVTAALTLVAGLWMPETFSVMYSFVLNMLITPPTILIKNTVKLEKAKLPGQKTNQRWPGTEGGKYEDHEGHFGVMELFYVLIVVVATWVHVPVKT